MMNETILASPLALPTTHCSTVEHMRLREGERGDRLERAGCAQALWGPGGGLDDDDIAVLSLSREWIKGVGTWQRGGCYSARGNVGEKRAVGR